MLSPRRPSPPTLPPCNLFLTAWPQRKAEADAVRCSNRGSRGRAGNGGAAAGARRTASRDGAAAWRFAAARDGDSGRYGAAVWNEASSRHGAAAWDEGSHGDAATARDGAPGGDAPSNRDGTPARDAPSDWDGAPAWDGASGWHASSCGDVPTSSRYAPPRRDGASGERSIAFGRPGGGAAAAICRHGTARDAASGGEGNSGVTWIQRSHGPGGAGGRYAAWGGDGGRGGSRRGGPHGSDTGAAVDGWAAAARSVERAFTNFESGGSVSSGLQLWGGPASAHGCRRPGSRRRPAPSG